MTSSSSCYFIEIINKRVILLQGLGIRIMQLWRRRKIKSRRPLRRKRRRSHRKCDNFEIVRELCLHSVENL
jgi:hypothetical protein